MIRSTLQLFAPSFKRLWPYLVATTILSEMSARYSIYWQSLYPESTVFGFMLDFFTGLLVAAVLVPIGNQAYWDSLKREHHSLTGAFSKNIKYMMIEGCRALTPIMLKTLLFVIPGIIESFKLYFIPYIVQFDNQYKAGQVDALERSRNLVKGRLISACSFLLFLSVISMLPMYLLRMVTLTNGPYLYCLVFFISMVLRCFFDLVSFVYYMNLNSKRVQDGNSI